VEIGANTTVDRGALGDTVLEEGVKLDNQIQVGHNVRIGAHYRHRRLRGPRRQRERSANAAPLAAAPGSAGIWKSATTCMSPPLP